MAEDFGAIQPQQLFRQPVAPINVDSIKSELEAEYENARELDRTRRWESLSRAWSQMLLDDSQYIAGLQSVVNTVSNESMKTQWQDKFQNAKYSLIQNNQKLEDTRIRTLYKQGAISAQQAYESYMALAKQSEAFGTRQSQLDAEAWKLAAVTALKSGSGGGGGGGGDGLTGPLDLQDTMKVLKLVADSKDYNQLAYKKLQQLNSIYNDWQKNGSVLLGVEHNTDGIITGFTPIEGIHSEYKGDVQTLTPELYKELQSQISGDFVYNLEYLLSSDLYWKGVNSGDVNLKNELESLKNSMFTMHMRTSQQISNPWSQYGLDTSWMDMGEIEDTFGYIDSISPTEEQPTAIPTAEETSTEENIGTGVEGVTNFFKNIFGQEAEGQTTGYQESSSYAAYRRDPLRTGYINRR